MTTPTPLTPAPPPTATRWVQYVLAFGVSVAIGLAPFLGKTKVPGFDALLSIIPTSRHATLIPLSALMMGTVAVVVQWFATDRPSRRWLNTRFKAVLAVLIVSFVALVVVETLAIAKVPVEGGRTWETFQVGFSRPNREPCPAEVSDAECIMRLTFNEALIASFWGDLSVRIAGLCLTLSYLGVTGAFGGLVGLLVIRQSREAS